MNERNKVPLYQRIASLCDARARCLDNLRQLQPKVYDDVRLGENAKDITTAHWRDMAISHLDAIQALVREHMPSGSGWDNGTSYEDNGSSPNKLVFYGSYHHMDDNGMYDGWTEHTVTIRPSLTSDIDVRVSGPNRNEIKDYLAELFDSAIRTEV